MINLIKNEFTKVFKKKTIYILLILTLGYIVLSNFIIKYTDNDHVRYYYFEGDIPYYEEALAGLDPSNPVDYQQYLENKRQLDALTLTREYGNDSWQAYVINTKLIGYIDTMIAHEYTDTVTEEAYNEAKSAYDEALERMEADDWKYFVNADLEDINASLEQQYEARESAKDDDTLASINKAIRNLELEKQINEWRLEKDISYAPSALNNSLEEYSSYQSTVYEYEDNGIENLSDDERSFYENSLEQAALNKYYIENNISIENDNRNILLNLFNNYEVFILIFAIVIAASIVSEEFSRGTIKLLLVKPYNRVKILMSKFIVCVLILILAILFIAISQLIIGGFIHGFDSLSTPAIIYNLETHSIETMGILPYVALIGVCKFPIYLLLTTLTFACSTIFTNTALAVAVPFLGYIASNIINQFALLYDLKWIVYFVTPNWDFTQYLFGGSPMFEGLTPIFSLVICLAYFFIMLAISTVVFKKRDIKNI